MNEFRAAVNVIRERLEGLTEVELMREVADLLEALGNEYCVALSEELTVITDLLEQGGAL